MCGVASEGPCPRHLVVTSNGHLYSLDVICEDQRIISMPELKQYVCILGHWGVLRLSACHCLYRQFSWIESHSKSIERGPSVGALTSTNRDVWAEVWRRKSNFCIVFLVLFVLWFVELEAFGRNQHHQQGDTGCGGQGIDVCCIRWWLIRNNWPGAVALHMCHLPLSVVILPLLCVPLSMCFLYYRMLIRLCVEMYATVGLTKACLSCSMLMEHSATTMK